MNVPGVAVDTVNVSLDEIQRRITEVAPGLHTAGTFSARAFDAIAQAARKLHIQHSAETGSGASTLLFSHLSEHHTVFALDDGSGSVENIRRSPLLNAPMVTFARHRRRSRYRMRLPTCAKNRLGLNAYNRRMSFRAATLFIIASTSLPVFAADLAPTGTLRVAFLRTNPVQGRIDPGTGAITGPVADLTEAFAKQLGVPYQIVAAANADDIISRLKAHTVDIGFLAYDAPRAREVDFSEPYALMLNSFLVRADSPIKRSADVDRSGIRVGTVKGQSQEVVLREILKQAEIKIMPATPPTPELAKMLSTGEIDAFGANRQRLVEAAAEDPKVRVLADNFSVAEQSIVVATENAGWLGQINGFIEKARTSGLVKSSLERAKLTAGVEVATGHSRR